LRHRIADFSLIVRRSGINVDNLQADLEREIRNLQKWQHPYSGLSPHLQTLFEHGWLIASLEGGNLAIRSGHLLLALLTHSELSQLALRGSMLFAKFKVDELKHDLHKFVVGSMESPPAVDAEGNTGPAWMPRGDPLGNSSIVPPARRLLSTSTLTC
jgi:type VI secretion system protein VasG